MATLKNIHDHSDIINRPYQKSSRHHWMSNQERAAQFAPFSALNGHKKIISDKEKVYVAKKQLDDDQIKIVDRKLRTLIKKGAEDSLVRITFFMPVIKENLGEYHTKWGYIKKIDQFHQIILLKDDYRIKIENIYEVDIEEK